MHRAKGTKIIFECYLPGICDRLVRRVTLFKWNIIMSVNSLSSFPSIASSNYSSEIEKDVFDAVDSVALWIKDKWKIILGDKKWVSMSWQGTNVVCITIKLQGSDAKTHSIYLGLFELTEYNPLEKKFYPLKKQDIEELIKNRVTISFRDRILPKAKL